MPTDDMYFTCSAAVWCLQQQQQQSFYGRLSRTTWVSR